MNQSALLTVAEHPEYRAFEELTQDDRFEISFLKCVKEPVERIDKHYVIYPAWAARTIAKIRPEKHVDIASAISFNTIVSAFVPIDIYDYRVFEFGLDGLKTTFSDLTRLSWADNSIPSLSCMHAVEHIGLGRYGGVLDPEGDLKAIAELIRVLAGDLLFVVPIGKPRVIFNLHRVYSYEQIMGYFSELKLIEFSLIPDSTQESLIKDATKELADQQNYGCGCFWFRKERR